MEDFALLRGTFCILNIYMNFCGNVRLFYKQQFYEQRQDEIGKK